MGYVKRFPHDFVKLAITVFAVGALIFGASEVLAGNPATDCMINPPHELGECTSDPQCQDMCELVNPPGVTGDCSNGCCGCRQR